MYPRRRSPSLGFGGKASLLALRTRRVSEQVTLQVESVPDYHPLEARVLDDIPVKDAIVDLTPTTSPIPPPIHSPTPPPPRRPLAPPRLRSPEQKREWEHPPPVLLKDDLNLSDDDIVRRVMGGEEELYSLLFLRYHGLVTFIAQKIVKRVGAVDDLVSEVLTKGRTNLHQYYSNLIETETGNFKAWIGRIATNRSYNVVRDRNRRRETLAKPATRDYLRRGHMGSADASQAVMYTQLQEKVNAAIQGLTENHRQIIMLRFYDDLSYQEIADTLNIGLGTVMSRLSRAKARLGKKSPELARYI
jgi:RNA polymerase sigma-70 factor, ECF subfamily